MNKKRELIKDMMVLLELLAQRETEQETKDIELSSQITWLRGTNDRLEADLRLAKTALVETMRLFNNQPNDSYEQAERKKRNEIL